jgi:hypothetical protein
LTVNLNKSIKPDKALGYYTFGLNDDYPDTIEQIVLGSVTAKACRDIYARFLIGSGFESDINNIVVGKDIKSRDIKVIDILRHACYSVALNKGFYLHVNYNVAGEIVSLKPIPFKNCRFQNADDTGYINKIGVYDNWAKKRGQKFEKDKINWIKTYSNVKEVLEAQIINDGGIDKFKGHVYFGFLDNEYIYPLSIFDSVYLDADTEQQLAIFKNAETRNGLKKKTIITMVEPSNDDEKQELEAAVTKWLSVEGDSVITVYGEVNAVTGEVNKSNSIAVDQIESNIDDKMFENWQKELSNNIRKAIKNMPKILIDYDESNLGGTSGEAIIQATNLYNAYTQDDRNALSEMFKDLLSTFDNPILKANVNWNIKKIELYEAANTKS